MEKCEKGLVHHEEEKMQTELICSNYLMRRKEKKTYPLARCTGVAAPRWLRAAISLECFPARGGSSFCYRKKVPRLELKSNKWSKMIGKI